MKEQIKNIIESYCEGINHLEFNIADLDKMADEILTLQLQQTGVSGSLPYNEKVLMHLWYSRNPSHEINTNTEEDMFWKTVFMVMKDYIREVGGNDR